MSQHPETTGAREPGRAGDPLAQAVAEAVTGIHPPPPRVDLEQVRRRGRRRRTLRRTALAVPAAAGALVLTSALWSSGTPWTSTTPAPPAATHTSTTARPAPAPSATPARSAEPQLIARAVFRDALLNTDPELDRHAAVGALQDGHSGQALCWVLIFQDRRISLVSTQIVKISL